MELMGEVLDKIPKIDPAVCSEIKNGLAAVEDILDLDKFHVQVPFADLCLTELERFLLTGRVSFGGLKISRVSLAQY